MMSMKFDYILVEQVTKEALKTEVEKLLEKGYAFVGGGGGTLRQNDSNSKLFETAYTQAMVLYIG